MKYSKSTYIIVGAIVLIGIGLWAIKNPASKTTETSSTTETPSQTGQTSTIQKKTTTPTKTTPSKTTTTVQSGTAGWTTYKNEFQLQVPQGWNTNTDFIGYGVVTFASSKDVVPGLTVPPSPNMWVEVKKGECTNPNPDFVPQASPSISLKRVCSGNFQISLGIWQDDQQGELHKQILNQILATFKVL